MIKLVYVALRQGGTQPRRLVLICPSVDATKTNPAIADIVRLDRVQNVAGNAGCARLYAGDLPLSDPRVSPLHDDLDGLAPMTVFTATPDITRPSTHLLVAKARAAGVPVDLHEILDGQHVYPLLPTREGGLARAESTRLISG
jgi:Esterase/lipase